MSSLSPSPASSCLGAGLEATHRMPRRPLTHQQPTRLHTAALKFRMHCFIDKRKIKSRCTSGLHFGRSFGTQVAWVSVPAGLCSWDLEPSVRAQGGKCQKVCELKSPETPGVHRKKGAQTLQQNAAPFLLGPRGLDTQLALSHAPEDEVGSLPCRTPDLVESKKPL